MTIIPLNRKRCLYCGKLYKPKRKKVYSLCSTKCSNGFHKSHFVQSLGNFFNERSKCIICDKEFFKRKPKHKLNRTPFTVRSYNSKTCSKQCSKEYCRNYSQIRDRIKTLEKKLYNKV